MRAFTDHVAEAFDQVFKQNQRLAYALVAAGIVGAVSELDLRPWAIVNILFK